MVDSLYFIRSLDTGLVKIGHSKNPEQRIKVLRAETKESLEFAFVGYGGYRHEQTLHERFKDDRVRGEWFRSSFDLELEIDFRVAQQQQQVARWAERRRVVAEEAELVWQDEYADTYPSEAKAAFIAGYAVGNIAGVSHEYKNRAQGGDAQIYDEAAARVDSLYLVCTVALKQRLAAKAVS